MNETQRKVPDKRTVNRFARKRVIKRWLVVLPTKKTVRNLIREHLAFERKTIKQDFSRMLGIAEQSAASMMTKTYPLAPQHIDAFIEGMKLDEWDANELRLQGAIESGWQINVKLLKEKPA